MAWAGGMHEAIEYKNRRDLKVLLQIETPDANILNTYQKLPRSIGSKASQIDMEHNHPPNTKQRGALQGQCWTTTE